MSIPQFDQHGDLPVGLHAATLEEVVERFGQGTHQRQAVAQRLLRIHELARATGGIQRFILFGSFVTAKPTPNDVDIVLVMRDTFNVMACDKETRSLFDHQAADREFGASIFWTRPSLLILETVDDFVAHWQIKRDQTRRGIVEVSP